MSNELDEIIKKIMIDIDIYNTYNKDIINIYFYNLYIIFILFLLLLLIRNLYVIKMSMIINI